MHWQKAIAGLTFCLASSLAAAEPKDARAGQPAAVSAVWHCWYELRQPMHVTCFRRDEWIGRPIDDASVDDDARAIVGDLLASNSGGATATAAIRRFHSLLPGTTMLIPLHYPSDNLLFMARLARATMCYRIANCEVSFDFGLGLQATAVASAQRERTHSAR